MGHAQAVRDAFGYLYPAEMDLMVKLAKELPQGPVIVNIGAGAGTSGLLWIETRPDATLYTIDIQDSSSPFGCLEGERQVFKEAGLWHLLNHSWYQVHSDSKLAGQGWLYDGFPFADLVFVDGDHSYKGCRGDIEAWLPNLVTGGVMLVHDYLKESNDPTPNGRTKPYKGVDQAVQLHLIDAGYRQVGHADTLIAFRKELP